MTAQSADPKPSLLSAWADDRHGSSSGGANPFAAFEILPMPIIVLSAAKIVLAASRATRKLLAWPSTTTTADGQPQPSSVFGLPFAALGIEILHQRDSNDFSLTLEQILDGLADEFKRTLEVPESGTTSVSNVGASSAPAEPSEDDDEAEFDPWPEEDWSRGPDITLIVKVQRRTPGSKPFKARIIARVWKVESEIVFLLTIGRPVSPAQKAENTEEVSQSSKLARRLLKRVTLAKMQRALFNSLQWPCYFFSPDETMYYPNEAGKQLTGQLDEDFMFEQGHAILQRIDLWDENFEHKLSVDEFPGIQIVRTRKRMENQKFGFYDVKTNSRVRLDLGGDCLYDDFTGEFLGAVMWCRDVTEYTEVIERQRHEIDRGLENKLDNMPNLMFTTQPWPLCEADYFSKQWFDYTGHPRDYNPIQAWREAVHPDDIKGLWEAWLVTTEEGEAFMYEARYRRHDGEYRWHLVRAVPQRDHTGEIIKYYGAFVDINDLVAKRTEARRRKQQMITVLAHAEVNLFAVNQNMETTMLEGKIQWGPDAAENRTTGHNALGRDISNVLEHTTAKGTASAEEMLSNIRRILDGSLEMSVFEHNIDNRWYKTRIIPDIDYSETGSTSIVGVLGLSIDITDVKARIELELERTQLLANEEAAQEANRLKSQFLANVSHELRTPIAGVLGMADLLIETFLDAEQKEYARAIQQSADSLLTIVNDILDFAKIESGRFNIEEVRFDLPRVLADLAKLMGYAAKRKGLTLDYQSTLARSEQVIGDPGRVRQILMNLLTNAIKFTKNGTITFQVDSQEIDGRIDCTFVIQDTGIGIRPAVLKQLFRPFCQGDSSTQRLFGGTGLGLTICKELSDLMKGEISLESTSGVGTKATFLVPFGKPLTRTLSIDESYVPSHLESPQGRIPSPASPLELNLRPLRRPSYTTEAGLPSSIDQPQRVDGSTQILVVEDNAINRNIAVRLVKKLGFQAKAVSNGEECLEYLANPCDDRPRPSIILMDCQMPVMDGYEATRAIRTEPSFSTRFKDIPIIALTASAIVGDREKCKAAGMDDYVTKPVSKPELERALLKWLHQKEDEQDEE